LTTFSQASPGASGAGWPHDRRPLSLDAALASFDELWDPRIVARVNDYDVRIARVAGEFA
jgi:hypothetical protein